MPRLNKIEPAHASGRVKEIFEGPLKSAQKNIFKHMANSTAALEVYVAMSGALKHSSLSDKEREAIQLAIGQANNCHYCIDAHTAIGKMSGLTEAQTIEARKGRMSDPKLNALVRFALAIHEKKGFVSDADVAAFKQAGYTDASVADAVACYALALYTNYFNHVNETESDFPAAPKI